MLGSPHLASAARKKFAALRAYACSVEAHLDAEMPARMPARPAESPRHERVFINFGGPQGHGDSLTVVARMRAAGYCGQRPLI